MSSIQANASQPSLPLSMPLNQDSLPTSHSDETETESEIEIETETETDSSAVPNPTDTDTNTSTESPGAFTDVLLDAVKDARQIVRLIQCQICNNILQYPITLPCGNSICRACLPTTRPRVNISWPATASRLQGFDCPFPSCGREHAAADCALDVTLNKVLTIIKNAVASHQSAIEPLAYSTHVTVRDQWGVAGLPSLEERHTESRVIKGGRILATYTLAELGNLEYSNEVSYSSVGVDEAETGKFDSAVFLELKELVKTEMDCQVCYALFLDPMTTTCGHTAQADPRTAPSNGRLVSILSGFWADLVALRSQAYRQEQQANHGGFDVPIFVYGYVVANIEKVDDISLAEEEALESSELSRETDTTSPEDPDSTGTETPSVAHPSYTKVMAGDLDSISTKELVDFGVDFVRRMQAKSVRWLAARMLAIYGECPEGAATFPWWFACVFPVNDAEKYRLLGTSSVRERLKICCRWIAEWETSRAQINSIP
ncbi:hypothetical protein ONZ43_g2694 [Nemania bipapillata]|uniref:Uncharacterized protein n=1 Tax=Nemania bipapillata TaxID=110536 RepID=A0ACC2IZR1_9PEZI|nr:hypothetical protein ONZ43_g2694 [Nemania bipapillata]